MKVSAVIVSRMDHTIGQVVDSVLPFVDELIVVRGHNGVWERWEAVSRCKNDVVYVQDDDAVVDVASVISGYQPGFVTCNMPPDHRRDYPDEIALVGWGCVFENPGVLESPCGRMSTEEFSPFWAFFRNGLPLDDLFRRECDRVFTGLSPLKLINVAIRHLPFAHGDDRMGRELCHGRDLQEIRRRIYAVRASRKS